VKFKAVLFDLDGTLADTAPDLGAALNRLRAEESLPPIAPDTLRPHTSAGTRGMLRVGFGLSPGELDYQALAERFLAHYMRCLCIDTKVFPELGAVLDALDAQGIQWGVVTNKPHRFTEPLMDALELAPRCACIVSGDSTPRPKPAPDSLLLAASTLDIAAGDIVYVGDDLRDIQAGQAASMHTIAARWGYLGVDTPIENWQADWIADTPSALQSIFEL
jgi:phosphoglycolate phosphatase